MMRTSLNSCRIAFAGGLWLYLALLLLVVPLRWFLAALAGAAVHEGFHILMIRLLGVRIHSVKIGIFGAKIHTEQMTDSQELLCALSGPVGGLSLLLFARWMPMVSICAAVQSLYNLLPVYPADGGRALRCGTRLLLPEHIALGVCSVVEAVALAGIAALGIYGAFRLHLGAWPMILAFAIVFSTGRKK